MEVDGSLVSFILTTYYDMKPIVGSVKQLCGYSAKNFFFVAQADHRKYVLKIVSEEDSNPELIALLDEVLVNAFEFTTSGDGFKWQFVVPKTIRTTGDRLSTYTNIRHRPLTLKPGAGNDQDDYRIVPCNLKLCEYFEGVTMLDLINSYPSLYEPEQLYRQLGRMANQLFRFFRTQGHLAAQLKSLRAGFDWQLIGPLDIVKQRLLRLYPDPAQARRKMVEKVLEGYEQVERQLAELPEFVYHSDLCNRNILIDHSCKPVTDDTNRMCLIDFQDIQVGPQVAELAILILYNVLEQEQVPLETALRRIPKWIVAGYQSSGMEPIQEEHAKLLGTLMKLRLVQSLLNGQVAYAENPSNADYVLHTNQRGWQLLELMTSSKIEEELEKRLVEACGAV